MSKATTFRTSRGVVSEPSTFVHGHAVTVEVQGLGEITVFAPGPLTAVVAAKRLAPDAELLHENAQRLAIVAAGRVEGA